MKRKKRNILSCKKGDLSLDLLWLPIVVFILGISFFFLGDVFKDINEDIQGFTDMSNESKEQLNKNQENFNTDNDGIIAFLYFGFALFLIVSAFFLDSHPIFFVFSLIIFLIIVFVIVILANTFEEFATDPSLAETTAEFGLTIFIMKNAVELSLAIGFFVGVILYGKYRS